MYVYIYYIISIYRSELSRARTWLWPHESLVLGFMVIRCGFLTMSCGPLFRYGTSWGPQGIEARILWDMSGYVGSQTFWRNLIHPKNSKKNPFGSVSESPDFRNKTTYVFFLSIHWHGPGVITGFFSRVKSSWIFSRENGGKWENLKGQSSKFPARHGGSPIAAWFIVEKNKTKMDDEPNHPNFTLFSL